MLITFVLLLLTVFIIKYINGTIINNVLISNIPPIDSDMIIIKYNNKNQLTWQVLKGQNK